MHADGGDVWAGDGVGGGEQHWAGGGVGDEFNDGSDVQGGGEVQGQPDQAAGEAYRGGPLSSTIGGQATEGRSQKVQEPTLCVAHLTSLGKWNVFFCWGWFRKAYEAGEQDYDWGQCFLNPLHW